MSKLSHKQNIFKVFVLFSFCIFPSYTSISYMNQYSHIQNKEIDSTLPDEQKLIYELLSTYDTAARPVFNASKNVIIDISLSLIQISDMDERNQIFTSNVWIEQEWLDERLAWNRTKYNNLDKLRIPCNRLWLPDIVLYNSADDYNKGYMQSKAMVKPDGRVFWPLPIKLRSSCKIDVTYFPFDDQVCSWKFGSWTYSGLQVDMNNIKESGDLTNYVESGEWHLRAVTAVRHVVYYPCCPNEPYPDITFQILIRRRVLYFLFNIILPCVWLSVLSLIGFWLPPDSGEKITLGITVLLAFSVFMLLIAENIPATSETVPLIVIYLTSSMSLTSFSIILTVLLHQLHHAGNYAPMMSRRFYYFMTRKAAFVVGMCSTVKRYEAQKQIGKIYRKTHKKETIKNQTNNMFFNSLKDRQKSNIGLHMPRQKNNNSHLTSHQQNYINKPNGMLKSKTEDHIELERCAKTNKEIRYYNMIQNLSDLNTLSKANRSNTLPMLNYEYDVVGEGSEYFYKNDEILRNIKKINNGIKHLLGRENENSNVIANEWKLIGIIMDRLIFWTFFTITICSSSFLLIILPVLKHYDFI